MQKVEGVANDVQAVSDIPLLKNGVVKSVQRGIGKAVYVNNKGEKKIVAIAELNPEKSVLICNYTIETGNSDAHLSGLMLKKDGIYVTRYDSTSYWAVVGGLSWQVIEFY